MNCPTCDSLLIEDEHQSACLVTHNDNLEYTNDGKIHDHATPCDYGGGIHFKCINGHLIAVPTYNECWCGFKIDGNDGGFYTNYKRHSIKLPWRESVDYWERRIRDEPRFDHLSTRNMGLTGEYITLDVDGNIHTELTLSANGTKV